MLLLVRCRGIVPHGLLSTPVGRARGVILGRDGMVLWEYHTMTQCLCKISLLVWALSSGMRNPKDFANVLLHFLTSFNRSEKLTSLRFFLQILISILASKQSWRLKLLQIPTTPVALKSFLSWSNQAASTQKI